MNRPPPAWSVTALLARDPEALGAFFDVHFDRVYGLAFRLVGHRATAEDLTQETFLRIQRGVDTLDPSRDPWPWIAQIVTNLCRDHWRSAATRHGQTTVSLDTDDRTTVPVDQEPDPETAAVSRQAAESVQAALQRLPEAGRLVVLLHDYRGLSHDEIADVTGINHAAVRQQYRRALKALGRMLRGVWT